MTLPFRTGIRSSWLVLVAVGTLLCAPLGSGAITTINVHGDSFYNYDFHSTSTASGRDWPVDVVWYNTADQAKVKAKLCNNGLGKFCTDILNSTQYAAVINASGGYTGWYWDGDGGKKTSAMLCTPISNTDDDHYRVYGDPRKTLERYGYNAAWGYYTLATAHHDHNDGGVGCSQTWFGNSEVVEGIITSEARKWIAGATVRDDQFALNNAESGQPDPRLHFNNDGYASGVRLP